MDLVLPRLVVTVHQNSAHTGRGIRATHNRLGPACAELCGVAHSRCATTQGRGRGVPGWFGGRLAGRITAIGQHGQPRSHHGAPATTAAASATRASKRPRRSFPPPCHSRCWLPAAALATGLARGRPGLGAAGVSIRRMLTRVISVAAAAGTPRAVRAGSTSSKRYVKPLRGAVLSFLHPILVYMENLHRDRN